MSVLIGHIPNGLGGTIFPDNPNLTTGMRALEYLDWPYRQSIVTHDDIRSSHLIGVNIPVTIDAKHAIIGMIPHTYLDDLYFRCHVIPTRLDLGNVVTTQVERVDVWNAYFETKILTTITGEEEGLDVSDVPTPPMFFYAGQLTSWDLSTSASGSAVLDATLTWVFEDANDPTLQVTANRIVEWALTPDWADAVSERIGFLTDVLVSVHGTEQRRALRQMPRRVLEAMVLVEGRERRMANNMLLGWGGNMWALPIWHDVQRLTTAVAAGATVIPCITTYRDFVVGNLVLLRSPSAFLSEAAEILSFTASTVTLVRPLIGSWPTGTRVYPVRTARLRSQPGIKRLHDRAWQFNVEFELQEACDWTPATFATTYRSHPVFAERPDEAEELDLSFERMEARWDNEVGFPFVVDPPDSAFGLQQHSFVLHGEQEHDAFRRLLYALRGRQVSVWVPTHADDMTVVSLIPGSTNQFQIEHCDFTMHGFDQLGQRDLRIEMKNGTVYHRRITAASVISDSVEQITIDALLSTAVIQPSEFLRISFMRLMRAAEDETTIQHETDIKGVATATITWKGIRDDV